MPIKGDSFRSENSVQGLELSNRQLLKQERNMNFLELIHVLYNYLSVKVTVILNQHPNGFEISLGLICMQQFSKKK